MEIKDVKMDKKVTFVRRNGSTAHGVVYSKPVQMKNGVWVLVNTGSKLSPVVTNVRITNLQPA